MFHYLPCIGREASRPTMQYNITMKTEELSKSKKRVGMVWLNQIISERSFGVLALHWADLKSNDNKRAQVEDRSNQYQQIAESAEQPLLTTSCVLP